MIADVLVTIDVDNLTLFDTVKVLMARINKAHILTDM